MHLDVQCGVLIVVMAATGALSSGEAKAQAYPVKPIRIVVPLAPGGGVDITSRTVGAKMAEGLKQNVIIDNRPGGATVMGTEIVAKSPPDGYTLVMASSSHAIHGILHKLPFDPIKDFAAVSLVATAPLVLVVHPSVPVKSVKDLVALAKREQGKMNAAHNGSGTTSHLSIEMLKQFAGVDVTPIPYKGGGPAIAATLAGETDFAFATALAAQPHIKSGKVRPLAVTTAKRSSSFPELPTMDSLYPGFESDNWYAMFFPAGTPRDIVAKLNGEIVKALKANDVRDFIVHEGGDPVGSSPAELEAYFKREVGKYAKIIRAGNITAE